MCLSQRTPSPNRIALATSKNHHQCTSKSTKWRTKTKIYSHMHSLYIWQSEFYQHQEGHTIKDPSKAEYQLNQTILVSSVEVTQPPQPTSKSCPFLQHLQRNPLASQLPTSASHERHKTEVDAHKSNMSHDLQQLCHLASISHMELTLKTDRK